MNRLGQYTDHTGRVLFEGDTVELLAGDISGEFKGSRGDVVKLPDHDSDWYGYVRVIIPGEHYRRVWAMDTQLKFIPPPEKP